MKYKAVFVDVDGTLIPNYTDLVPSPRVSEAIAKARKKGVHVGLVTGRPMKYLENIFAHLRLEGPSVIVNGTQVIDSVTKEILWQQALSFEDLSSSLAITKQFASRIIINDEGIDIPYTTQTNIKLYKNPLLVYIESLPGNEADDLVASLTHMPTITATKTIGFKSGQSDVIISHVNATKQHGLLTASEILGISTREIIGIGDGYNDFPLMMAAGFKVAMGNAIEDLKDIADYIAPTVDADGVADVIEKFVLAS